MAGRADREEKRPWLAAFSTPFSCPVPVHLPFFLTHFNFPLQQKRITSGKILQLSQEVQYKRDEPVLGLKQRMGQLTRTHTFFVPVTSKSCVEPWSRPLCSTLYSNELFCHLHSICHTNFQETHSPSLSSVNWQEEMVTDCISSQDSHCKVH